MALSAHLQELSDKHRQLERRIEEETARPGSDDLAIRRLKQEKLKLKDEISRLEIHTTLTTFAQLRSRRSKTAAVAKRAAYPE